MAAYPPARTGLKWKIQLCPVSALCFLRTRNYVAANRFITEREIERERDLEFYAQSTQVRLYQDGFFLGGVTLCFTPSQPVRLYQGDERERERERERDW